MAVTKEQILSAADRIAADGRQPTLEAVRQIVGGSYTTISPVLNEWKARQASAATPIRDAAPAPVTDRAVEFAAAVWATALGLANDRLQSERQALEQTRQALEQAGQEATELADKVTTERDAAREQAQELAAEIERLRTRLEAEQQARIAAEQQAAMLAGQLDMARGQYAALLDRITQAAAEAMER